MKKITFFFVLLICLFTLTSIYSQGIPETINYQGILKDAAGVVVPNGDYNLTFKLYDVESGGAAIWSESKIITVSNGIVNTQLGSVTPIPPSTFNAALWLGIAVAAGTELAPRIALTSAPYSIYSLNVPDGSITATKIADDEVVKSVNGLKNDVNLVAGANVTITPSGNDLTISSTGGGSGIGGSGTANYIPKFTNSTTLGNSVLFDDGNKIGIGTTTPDYSLTINSNSTSGLALKLSRGGGLGMAFLEEGQPVDGKAWAFNVYQQKFKINTAADNGYTQIKNIMTFDRAGNVGVGTETPTHQLEVLSDGQVGIYYNGNNAGWASIYVNALQSTATSGYGYVRSGILKAYTGLTASDNWYVSTGGSSNKRIVIQPNGYMGIGTDAPVTNLQLVHDQYVPGGGFTLQQTSNSNRWQFYVSQSNNFLRLFYNDASMGGFDNTNGNYTPVSDMRLKKNIQPINNMLNVIMELQPKTYQMKADNSPNNISYGLIAQDVEKVLPELITVYNGDDGDGIKDLQMLSYTELIPILIKAMQEQQAIIEDLTKRVQTLENK